MPNLVFIFLHLIVDILLVFVDGWINELMNEWLPF